MGFIDGIKARAKADLKTIVLPESYDLRVIEAASKIEKEGVAKVILIGDPEGYREIRSKLRFIRG